MLCTGHIFLWANHLDLKSLCLSSFGSYQQTLHSANASSNDHLPPCQTAWADDHARCTLDAEVALAYRVDVNSEYLIPVQPLNEY